MARGPGVGGFAAVIAVLNGIAGFDSNVAIYSNTLRIYAFGIVASGVNIWIGTDEILARNLMHQRDI